MDDALRKAAEQIYDQKQARREAAKPTALPAMTRAQRLSRDKVFRYFAEESLNDQRMLDFTLREEVPEAWRRLVSRAAAAAAISAAILPPNMVEGERGGSRKVVCTSYSRKSQQSTQPLS